MAKLGQNRSQEQNSGKWRRPLHKYSSHILTEDQTSLLNKAPNFCASRKGVNATEVKVSNLMWQRKMLLRQKFHGREEEQEAGESTESVEGTEEVKILPKTSVKTNMPKGFSFQHQLL